MAQDTQDKWFTVMLAFIIVLLGAVGTMVIILNSQTWTKLDRMTALFLHEKDAINHTLSEVCKDQTSLKERVTRIETVADREHGGPKK